MAFGRWQCRLLSVCLRASAGCAVVVGQETAHSRGWIQQRGWLRCYVWVIEGACITRSFIITMYVWVCLFVEYLGICIRNVWIVDFGAWRTHFWIEGYPCCWHQGEGKNWLHFWSWPELYVLVKLTMLLLAHVAQCRGRRAPLPNLFYAITAFALAFTPVIWLTFEKDIAWMGSLFFFFFSPYS